MSCFKRLVGLQSLQFFSNEKKRDCAHNKNYRELQPERVIPQSAGAAVAFQGENGRCWLAPSRNTAHFVYAPFLLSCKSVERQGSLTRELGERDGNAATHLREEGDDAFD